MTVLNVHELGDPDGLPLLAVHGITAHGRRFRRLAEDGWPQRRTIAVDLRGHGRSTYDAPWNIAQHVTDLLDTLDSLGIEAADVVGHSYGGAIGLALLARAPERVRTLAMLDPALLVPGAWASKAAMDTIAHGGYESVEAATIDRRGGNDDIADSVDVEIAEHLVRGDDGRYRFRFHPPAVVTGWGEVCAPLPPLEATCPALLVIATQAQLVTPQVEAGLAALFGELLTTVRIDCGHMLYWERFDETAAAVGEFLA
jgi:lipase